MRQKNLHKPKTGGKIRPEDAARRLGRSAQDVRVGLQMGYLPIGTAYKRPGSSIFSYEIDPVRLEEYAQAQEAVWKRIAE
jgi:hypothetical protein